MNNLVIFPLIFFFLNSSPKLQPDFSAEVCCGISEKHINLFTVENNGEDSLCTIYLIKQRWHTAVVFHKDDVDTIIFPEVKYFKEAELIDIGWGDEEFYQYPGFDSGLAWQALFYSTPSTLRVEGIYLTKREYFDISEIVIELKINNEQLTILTNYLSETIWRDDENNHKILSTKGLGKIIFFKANGEYHLFNTCNTWLAEGLKQAGVKIDDDVILTEQLFKEAAEVGTVLKAE
jgi:uncharacterized protein (TIGR02117 family)